jgi:transglutaminase/protease-like cytokinesis protein 3
LTGAAEAYKGQAVEQEASNFVTGFASIAVGSATGQGAPSASASVASDEIDSADENATVSVDAEVGSSLPDPTSIVGGAANAQSTAFGESAKHDKTKKHVENAMWESAGPIMHGIAMIADIWERFAK